MSLYQPIEHPDYAGQPVSQPCFERWSMMLPFLKGSTAVDVGCHTGWFCRQFARIGWQATGYDRSRDWLDTAIAMNEFTPEPKPQYVHGNVMEMGLPECDVALCLSVVMYLFDDYDAGWRFLDRLSQRAKMMFMDFGGMYADKLPFTEDNVCQIMAEKTHYKTCGLIGRTDFENRPLFMLA